MKLNELKFIDVHCHLDKLKIPFDVALAQANALGVTRVITIGTEPEDHPVVLGYAMKYFPQVACTLGIHPDEAELWSESVNDWIRAKVNSSDPLESRGIVAVGEIGLDYYDENGKRAKASRDIQLTAFRRQMELAEELGLPVEIHTREADDDCAMVLNEYRGRVTGLLHCFTSSLALAKSAVDCGFDISISGVVTFKNAESLREVVKFLPLDRLHVETDSPFLAPMPQRGKSNLPEYVLHTAKYVADLKGITLEQLSETTRANAKRLFPKLVLD
ncbi:TatD family hydrolase [soil metagenome]